MLIHESHSGVWANAGTVESKLKNLAVTQHKGVRYYLPLCSAFVLLQGGICHPEAPQRQTCFTRTSSGRNEEQRDTRGKKSVTSCDFQSGSVKESQPPPPTTHREADRYVRKSQYPRLQNNEIILLSVSKHVFKRKTTGIQFTLYQINPQCCSHSHRNCLYEAVSPVLYQCASTGSFLYGDIC